MSERICAICGEAGAGFGYRLPGPRSALPEGRDGYLWVCAKSACHEAAQARQDAAVKA